MSSLDDTEDVALDFGTEDNWRKQKMIRYPLAAVFHLLFKVLAFVLYFTLSAIASFITTIVILIILLSLDFWIVKNITGRLLVGLRWWNHVDEDGTSHWVFESRRKGSKVLETNTESRIFWLGLIINPIIWFLVTFSSLLHPGWLIVPIMGLCFGTSNLYGYLRCKIGSRQEISSFATQFLGQQILNRAADSMTNPSQTAN